MVQQASAASKKKEVIPPAFASITAADIIRAPVVERTVPLDLLPLLKPFKRAGRLSLRIERLPQRAKMSAGRRNSDGSWSLASDELSDLNYLVPSNAPAEHELTIRVMGFEEGAPTTLKVLQHPIRLEEPSDPSALDEAICRSSEVHDPVLRSQLGEMQSLFAVRESELVELRKAVQQAKSESAAELQKARAAWEQELHQRLAEVSEQAEERQEHEHKKRDTKNQTTLKQAEERWRMQESVRTAAAHAEWQRQVAHERAEHSEKNTKLEAALAAETDKRRKLEAALAQAMAQAKPAPAAESSPELERLRGELAAVKTVLTERESELARNRDEQGREREAWVLQAGQHLEAEQKRWQAESEQRLERERQAWQSQIDQRIATDRGEWSSQAAQQAETQRQHWQAESEKRVEAERQAWRAETDRLVVKERERWQAEAGQHLETERQRWQADADRHAEKERQAWQARADKRLEEESKRREAESLSALKQAREQWQAEEAARAATAQAEWQNLSAQILAGEKDRSAKLEISLAVESDKCRKLETALAHALAQTQTQASSASASDEHGAVLARLREELAAAKTALTALESELVRSRVEREQERNRWQQEAQAHLDARAAAGKSEETARLKAMAEARAQSDEALAAMTLRCERAEQALAASGSAAPHADDGYIESLRAEVAELRNALVKSETELGWARSALDQAQPLHIRRAAENLPIGGSLPSAQEEEVEPAVSNKRALIRDFLIVVAVAVPVILFYPWFAGYLPEGLRSNLATVTGGLLSAGEEHAPVTHAVAPVAAPVVQRPTITVSRSVNVRATPAVKGAVLLTLPKGGSLIVLEQSGSWTHVEIPAKDAAGKAEQGWVFSTSLASKKESAKDTAKDSVSPAAPARPAAKAAIAPAVEAAPSDRASPEPAPSKPAEASPAETSPSQ